MVVFDAIYLELPTEVGPEAGGGGTVGLGGAVRLGRRRRSGRGGLAGRGDGGGGALLLAGDLLFDRSCCGR